MSNPQFIQEVEEPEIERIEVDEETVLDSERELEWALAKRDE